MKRDFLKNLGIEDKDIIDKIMDENSADIGRAKGDLDEVKAQLTKAQSDLAKKTTDYDTLKESTKDYDSLSEKINQLELEKNQLATDKAQLKVDLDAKVSQILRDHAIEGGVRDAKAKNVKAVMALLDMSKITYADDQLSGLTEQLEALQKGEDTSFLFTSDQTPPPAGTNLNNPPAGGGNPPTSNSFSEAVAKALGGNK